MNINKVIKFEDIIFDFLDKYENRVIKIQKSITVTIFNVLKVFERIMYVIIDVINGFYTVARYTTKPLHWLWIYGWIRSLKNKDEELPIFRVGAHYIYGRPAAGKSTMTYHAMMDNAYRTGKSSYSTEQMETARLDIDGRHYYHHQTFEPSDFFVDGEQKYQFENDFNMIVYEEMITKYNQRNNKARDYNNEVLPMIAAMGTQRHQDIDLFYFISQQPKADVQIMTMLAGYHEPKIRKVFDYERWLKTGKFSFRIKGWWITSSVIIPKGADNYEIRKEKRWFYENKYDDDFKYFNRLNMKATFAN